MPILLCGTLTKRERDIESSLSHSCVSFYLSLCGSLSFSHPVFLFSLSVSPTFVSLSIFLFGALSLSPTVFVFLSLSLFLSFPLPPCHSFYLSLSFSHPCLSFNDYLSLTSYLSLYLSLSHPVSFSIFFSHSLWLCLFLPPSLSFYLYLFRTVSLSIFLFPTPVSLSLSFSSTMSPYLCLPLRLSHKEKALSPTPVCPSVFLSLPPSLCLSFSHPCLSLYRGTVIYRGDKKGGQKKWTCLTISITHVDIQLHIL